MASNTDHTESSTEKYDDENDIHEPSTSTLSKKQQRRLQKQQKWQAIKSEVRAKEKRRKKQRRQEALERGDNLAPTRKKLKNNTMAKSSCHVRVVIDCSLDGYMNDKDIMKLAKQIQFCYSSNRRAENPLQFYVCGIHGQIKDRLEAIGDFINWDVIFTRKNYYEEFDTKDIVYLSSESDNLLEDLDPSKAYIIGGLVDHNHHKGLCHSKAVERGVSHARLPISEFLDMKTRKVLTINHVFDILLRYTESKNWLQAFCSVLPQRKGAQVKQSSQSVGEENTPSFSTGKADVNEKQTETSQEINHKTNNTRNCDIHEESDTKDSEDRVTGINCVGKSNVADLDNIEKSCNKKSADVEQLESTESENTEQSMKVKNSDQLPDENG